MHIYGKLCAGRSRGLFSGFWASGFWGLRALFFLGAFLEEFLGLGTEDLGWKLWFLPSTAQVISRWHREVAEIWM